MTRLWPGHTRSEGEPARLLLGQPATGDQAFRFRPQCLHPCQHHVHAERGGQLLAGQRALMKAGPGPRAP